MIITLSDRERALSRELEQRQLKELELQRQALIFDSIYDGVMLTDLEGRIIDWNRGAVRMFGYAKSEILGQTPSILHEPEAAILTQEVIQDIKHKGCWVGEINFVRKDGTRGICETTVVAHLNELGEIISTIGINHDITERKRREEILKDIASGVTIPIGTNFLSSLVEYLSKTLKVDYAFVGELNQPDRDSIKTLAIYSQDRIIDNFEYLIANTPCANVIGKELCIYPQAVRQLFPQDMMLQEMGIESYAGILIFDAQKTALGLIAILDSKPFQDLIMIAEVLKIFATRVTAELERQKIELSLKQSEQKFKAIFNQSFQFIGLLEPDGKIVEINQTALDFVGLTLADVVGKAFCDTPWWTISPETPQRCQQGVRRAARGEFVRFEVDCLGKDNRLITVDFTLTPIANELGKVIMLIPEGRDISDRKRAEESLRDSEGRYRCLSQTLEIKVQNRTDKLNRRQKQLETEILERQKAEQTAKNANRAKSEFLANMSHELRTPLNAIIGFAQLMSRDLSLNSSQQENLAIINRSGKHLLALIDDILDLSKIEADKAVLQESNFDLDIFLEDIKAMFGLRAKSQGLEFHLEKDNAIPQYVRADEKKLRQILINLLANAIKFTERGSVTLKVLSSNRDLSLEKIPTDPIIILFEVEDTGCGIAAAEIDNLFQAFSQTQSGLKSQEGTGLGLAISHHFAELMGGKISVSSIVEQRTIFKFEIPVTSVEDVTKPLTMSTARVIGLASNQPSYRILIVEDQPTNRRLLSQLLQTVGFEVQEATNGEEAIAQWSVWSPHLIWMDLRMPVMNGKEATDIIKATAKGRDTTIIALTASALKRQELLTTVGFDDFVTKPFVEAEIFAKMARYLGVRYIYREIPDISEPFNSSQVEPLSPSALAQMSSPWIEQLHLAAKRLDEGEIRQLIQQISNHPQLQQALKNLIAEVRFDIIVDITRSVAENE